MIRTLPRRSPVERENILEIGYVMENVKGIVDDVKVGNACEGIHGGLGSKDEIRLRTG